MARVTVLIPIFVLVASISTCGQATSVEKNFQANQKNYSQEHFAEGEDATSGYDYLFYKSGPNIVKVRSIWSSSVNRSLRIDDLFFDKGLAVFRRSTGPKKYFRTLVKGGTAPLTTAEVLYFSDGKLVRWTIKGVDVPKTDPKWSETEKAILGHARSELENYDWLKSGK